jgi:TonB family protein
VALFASISALGQRPDPVLKSFSQPQYPPLPRLARIQGQVQLQLFVNHLGDVVAVNVLSGHPMLAPAAVENVKSWKFQMPKNASLEDQQYETTFDFVIADRVDLPPDRNAQVTMDSFRLVKVITTSAFQDAQTSGCPSDKDKQPPPVTNTDFVEMSKGACYGTCSVYTVRVHANGRVDWDGHSFVAEKGKDTTDIGATLARDLIARFASADFWALCADYSRNITDSATTNFRVRIGDRTKVVSNYANSAPEWVHDLEYSVDDAADTHRWLHGDPRDEPLSHLGRDSYGPKPGLTPLMRAAARANLKQVKELIEDGADPNAADASGWTVLMYTRTREYDEASSTLHPDLIPILIKAGADPNYSSPRGDTPLMAAAYDSRFESTLARASANVNAQNGDGVSALMILATRAEADEIGKALLAGANPKLKDARGRTALDYLRLANCCKSPLRDPVRDTITHEGGECRSLDEDDFRKSEALLKTAMNFSNP